MTTLSVEKMTNLDLKVRTHEMVKFYADKWRSLRAWCAPIPMDVELKPHRGTYNLGLAWSGRGKLQVKITGRLSRDLATLLHEMAHLAAPDDEHHGARWKEMFIRGAAEALDADVSDFDPDVTKYAMDEQVIDMVECWLASLEDA